MRALRIKRMHLKVVSILLSTTELCMLYTYVSTHVRLGRLLIIKFMVTVRTVSRCGDFPLPVYQLVCTSCSCYLCEP